MLTQDQEILVYYYEKYFKNLDNIEYIEHVPDELILLQQQQCNLQQELIIIQESTLGISLSCIKLLFPICIKNMKVQKFEDIATFVLLLLNGEYYSAWNIRFKLKKQEDLKLTELICIRFPGSSCAFNYRLQLQSNLQNENRFFLKAYKKKNRSYHLWIYRLKYIQLISQQYPTIYQQECDLMTNLASKDVHNYSIFNHLLYCCNKCNLNLINWAQDLKNTFIILYQDQYEKEQEIKNSELQSLNSFIKQQLCIFFFNKIKQ